MFDVITPIQDDGEVFDAALLRENVNLLLGQGRRNIAINLSELEYIYSDTMNALFALNRHILDVNGRLALLGPNKDVAQILQSAGIYNFLKVYASEADLVKSSDDIIVQTSSYSLSAIRTLQDAPVASPSVEPASEFEDFRSGIADAFEVSTPPPAPKVEQPKPRPAAPVAPVQNTSAGFDELDSFGSPIKQAPSYKQPAPAPSAPQRPMPSVPKEVTQFDEPEFKPRPAAAQPKSKATSKMDRWEEEVAETSKSKKSPMPVIITVVLVVVIAAAAVIFVPPYLEANKNKEVSATPEPAKIPEVAAIPAPAVTTEPVVTTPAQAAPQQSVAPAAVAKERASKPEVERPRAPAAAAASSYTPPPPPPAPASVSRLIIQSIPSGARVILNNKPRGETPLELENFPKGKYRLIVSKDGYTTKVSSVDYVGGYQEENVELAFAEVAPAMEPVSAPPVTQAPPPPPPPPPPQAAPSASTGDPATIFISSIPPVADVYLDGRLIGKTNITKLNVFSGTHSMRFVKNGKEITKDMTFTSGENSSSLIKIP